MSKLLGSFPGLKGSFMKLLLPGPNGNSEGSEITLIWNCPCNFVFNIADSRINFVLELLLLKVGFKIKLLKKPPDLKETWDQSYNFCLKWSFLILKQWHQSGINQNFQKFTCKPQLPYMLLCVYDVTHVKTQFNDSNEKWWEMVKMAMRLFRRLFFHKIKYAKQNRDEMFCIFGGMTSLTPIQNFVTS